MSPFLLKINTILCALLLFSYFVDFSTGHATGMRIIGGYEAPNEFSKFHVSLQNLEGSHVCGGTVISQRHILTAAHCVNGASPSYIKAVVGTTNLKNGGATYNIAKIKMHEQFDYALRLHDVAILTIKETFDLNLVNIVNIKNETIKEGDTVVLSGFGSQEPNGDTGPLMFALDQKVFSQDTCKYAMRYVREVFDEMFCTFTTIGEGTCHGDSGGPLIDENNELVGIVSWGIPCAVGFPDVHTRTTPYIEWIENAKNEPTCTSKYRFLI